MLPQPRLVAKIAAMPCNLNASENQENDDDEENEPYSSSWIISPSSTMRPPG